MPYVDHAGLSRFAGKSKDFASSACAGLDMANWQRTAAAGAVSFSPVPEMPLDPVVNFLFSETGPASGTKSPDNPSTITGVSSVKVTRAGSNILPGNRKSNYSGEAGTFSTDADGYVSYSAMSDGRAFVYSICNAQVYLHAGQQYVLRTEVKTAATSSYKQLQILDENNTAVLSVSPGDSDNSHTFTPPHDGMYGVLYKIYDGVYRFSLYLGSTATAFEPYSGADYTVNLGGTYYGGSVDFSTGVMTVTWAKGMVSNNVVNIDETLSLTNTICCAVSTSFYHYGNMADSENYLICDKFPSLYGNGDTEHIRGTGGRIYQSLYLNIYVNKSRFDFSGAVDPANPTKAEKISAANAWLHANPITVYAKYFTPQIVQLTPTQIYSLSQPDPYTPRTNTVYSDQVSVQVGYPKSPQATQNELTNAVVSLGGNV